MRTLRTSVRRLVEFLLRSGDINSDRDGLGGVEAMQAGSEIHRTLQAAGGDAYQAEVSLAGSIFFPDGAFNPHAARLDIGEQAVARQKGFFLCIEGRADGIIDDGKHPLLIDEIKGVARDVSRIEKPVPVHEAQALCYAYLYLRKTRGAAALSTAFGQRVVVRLTYASMTTGEIRQLEHTYDLPDIEARFFHLLQQAERWAAWRVQHDEARNASLAALAFPFSPRTGQQQFMDSVASTIHAGKRLYVQAPTGSGKTIATLYPALKALGSDKATRIAFLTAKTMTRRAALDCLGLLRGQGLAAHVLAVTARDKICPLRDTVKTAQVRSRPLASLCNPVECPLARGHYDRANDALFEAIITLDELDLGSIQSVAERHRVCPYELQRDLARWSDVVVCDYHYAFAPSASLLGLADEPGESTVYLVDEAHNLVERMREMYSAELAVTSLKALERLTSAGASLDNVTKAVHAVVLAFPTWDRALQAGAGSGSGARGKQPLYQKARLTDALVAALTTLANGITAALERLTTSMDDSGNGGRSTRGPSARAVETFLALRDTSFAVNAFLGALQRSETGYVTFLCRDANGARSLKLFCVDPSHNLGERLERAKAAVFFSGTLLPMDYHRKLLAAQDDDASLDVPSSFDPSHQQVLIGSDLSARYSQRGPELYAHLAQYLVTVTQARPGNYLVFLPSYTMMDEVARTVTPLVNNRTTVVRQSPAMREAEREVFVAQFRAAHPAGTSLIGLCVLGGIFGESIDLPGQALVGVVVVGTGMPRSTAEREVIRDYFDAKVGKGFAYAYTYPGLIKVLQAAGRLIRTEQDRGVVLLLDDRFMEDELQKAFPKEWQRVQTCTLKTLPTMLARS